MVTTGFKVLPTRGGRWVELVDFPLLPDDRALVKMWEGKPGVHLLDLGESLRRGRKLSAGRQHVLMSGEICQRVALRGVHIAVMLHRAT